MEECIGCVVRRRMPLKLNGNFYKIAIRPAMLYGTKCWVVKHQYIHKMSSGDDNALLDVWAHEKG